MLEKHALLAQVESFHPWIPTISPLKGLERVLQPSKLKISLKSNNYYIYQNYTRYHEIVNFCCIGVHDID